MTVKETTGQMTASEVHERLARHILADGEPYVVYRVASAVAAPLPN